MFFRQKRSGKYTYLQIVENRWEEGRSKQRVIVTLGRLDELREQGRLDGLLRSGAKFSHSAILLTAQQRGELPVIATQRIGPELILQRLWSELKIPQVLAALLAERRFEFPVERAVFLTVMHRLFHSGSDRNCMVWKADYHLPATESLQLHQLYRAMAWLGEPLGEDDQEGATPFAPRCIKDQIEEGLFHRRRDLFSELALVFYDKIMWPRVGLVLLQDDSPSLGFSDKDKTFGVHLSPFGLGFHDKNDKRRAALELDEDGSPKLALYDKNGTTRAELGSTSLTITRPGVAGGKVETEEKRPESSLVLFDKKGKVIWNAP